MVDIYTPLTIAEATSIAQQGQRITIEDDVKKDQKSLLIAFLNRHIIEKIKAKQEDELVFRCVKSNNHYSCTVMYDEAGCAFTHGSPSKEVIFSVLRAFEDQGYSVPQTGDFEENEVRFFFPLKEDGQPSAI